MNTECPASTATLASSRQRAEHANTSLMQSPAPPPACVLQSFAREATAARKARAFVSETLQRWEIGDRLPDVLLCTGELAANACLHTMPGTGDFLVGVSMCHNTVRVAVHDQDPRPPQLRAAGEEATAGRGLLLVEGLSDRWGVDLQPPDGKAIWVDFKIAVT